MASLQNEGIRIPEQFFLTENFFNIYGVSHIIIFQTLYEENPLFKRVGTMSPHKPTACPLNFHFDSRRSYFMNQ